MSRADLPAVFARSPSAIMEVRRPALVLGLLLTALTACSVGTYGEEQMSSTPDAAMMENPANAASFTSMITPLVNPRCTSCHGTAQAPNLMSYEMLQAQYKRKPGNTNILVTKGDHSGIQYFNTTEKATVESWINNLQ